MVPEICPKYPILGCWDPELMQHAWVMTVVTSALTAPGHDIQDTGFGIRLRIDTIFLCCRERDVEVDFAVDGVELKTCRKVRP